MEVDAGHIKGMLNEPDLQPNATINGWICGILLFDFILRHVPAEHHLTPDALSRKRRAEEYSDYSDEDDDWFTSALLLLKMMKHHVIFYLIHQRRLSRQYLNSSAP